MHVAGAGGNWERFSERFDPKIVRQMNDASCVAAAGEMLAKRNGIDLSQAEILDKIGVLSNAEYLGDFLNTHAGNETFLSSFYDPKRTPKLLGVLEKQGGLVIFRDNNPLGHAVYVSKFDKKGRARILDPYDQTRYFMDKNEFERVLSEVIIRRHGK